MTRIRQLLLIGVLCTACGPAAAPQRPLEHPRELVGRWVRLREDSTWGDTLEFLEDGRVLGSTGHPVPASARWGVRDGPLGARQFCAADAKEGACTTFRFEGATLVKDGGPYGPSYFRRVP